MFGKKAPAKEIIKKKIPKNSRRFGYLRTVQKLEYIRTVAGFPVFLFFFLLSFFSGRVGERLRLSNFSFFIAPSPPPPAQNKTLFLLKHIVALLTKLRQG